MKNEQQPVLLHHLLPSPASPSKATEEAISRVQALKLPQTENRDILTAVTISRHIYVSDGSFPCHSSPATPRNPDKHSWHAMDRVPWITLFSYKTTLSHPGNCGELPMGRSRDSYPLSLHFLTSAHHTPANRDRPNPA